MKTKVLMMGLLGPVGLVGLAGLVTLLSCGDFTYHRTLEGKVVNTGSRFKASETGGQTKIALVVQASVSDEVLESTAGGPSGLAVECLSTRCAGIVENTCHAFACRQDTRWMEPEVIQCKHVKEITCP